jgi:hypothetical protein
LGKKTLVLNALDFYLFTLILNDFYIQIKRLSFKYVPEELPYENTENIKLNEKQYD